MDLDPTNGIVVRDEHVLLGWGRDYADVSPVQGVILGGGAHRLSVSVDLEPDENLAVQEDLAVQEAPGAEAEPGAD